MYNSPASWTEYFPTEIFKKRKKDYTEWNRCILAGYEYALYEKRTLKNKMEEMQNEIWRLQYAESELEKCRKEIGELKTKIEENEKLKETAERGFRKYFKNKRIGQ